MNSKTARNSWAVWKLLHSGEWLQRQEGICPGLEQRVGRSHGGEFEKCSLLFPLHQTYTPTCTQKKQSLDVPWPQKLTATRILRGTAGEDKHWDDTLMEQVVVASHPRSCVSPLPSSQGQSKGFYTFQGQIVFLEFRCEFLTWGDTHPVGRQQRSAFSSPWWSKLRPFPLIELRSFNLEFRPFLSVRNVENHHGGISSTHDHDQFTHRYVLITL